MLTYAGVSRSGSGRGSLARGGKAGKGGGREEGEEEEEEEEGLLAEGEAEEVVVLDDVDMLVRRGQLVVICGEVGALIALY
jgi:hypothetical protein